MTDGKRENRGTAKTPVTPDKKDGPVMNAPQKRLQRGDKTENTESSNMPKPFQDVHQKAITRGLREYFDKVASEPIPDEFLDILKKMDAGDGGK